jgi:hypothetical protein
MRVLAIVAACTMASLTACVGSHPTSTPTSSGPCVSGVSGTYLDRVRGSFGNGPPFRGPFTPGAGSVLIRGTGPHPVRVLANARHGVFRECLPPGRYEWSPDQIGLPTEHHGFVVPARGFVRITVRHTTYVT